MTLRRGGIWGKTWMSEAASLAYIQRKNTPSKESSQGQGPAVWRHLECSGNGKEVRKPGAQWEGSNAEKEVRRVTWEGASHAGLEALLILRGKVAGMFLDEWHELLPTFIPLLCLLGYKRTRGRHRECLGEHEIMGVKVKGGLNSGGSHVSSENERTSLWTGYEILKSKRSSYSK